MPTFVAGDIFDLSTVNITSNSTSTVDSNQIVGVINIGDATVGSNSWLLNGSGGSVVTMDNGISSSQITQTSTSFGDTISVPLELKGNLGITNNSADAARVLTLSGSITSSAVSGTQTLSVAGSAAGGTTFSGVIGDGASGGKVAVAVNAPNSTVIFSSSNTYTGDTTLSAGTVRIVSDAFGSSGTVNINGPITLRGAVGPASAAIRNDLNISSDFSYSSGAKIYIYSNAIDLAGGTRTVTMNNAADANLANTLTFNPAASGSITISNGTLKFVGGAGSSPTTPTAIEFDLSSGGPVVFNNANLHIGANATTTFLSANNAFGTTAGMLPNVIVDENGALNLSRRPTSGPSSRNLTIASLSGDGKVVNSSSGAGTAILTILGASGTNDAEFSGVIQDGGYAGTTLGLVAVTKQGTSTQILSGANTYSGATTVDAGTLLINNASGSGTGASNVTVNSGGALGGTGSISGAIVISAGGTLAPGASVESLASGALTLAGNSTFAYELDSSAPSSAGADLQVVSGNLAFGDPVTLTFTDIAAVPTAFALNTTFTLINYSGTWNGGFLTYGSDVLTDGFEFIAGLNLWQIDYNATSGGSNFTDDYIGGNYVNIVAVVPEPGTWVLVASSMGLLGVMRVLRRRRR